MAAYRQALRITGSNIPSVPIFQVRRITSCIVTGARFLLLTGIMSCAGCYKAPDEPKVLSFGELPEKTTIELEQVLLDGAQPMDVRQKAAELIGQRGEMRSVPILERACREVAETSSARPSSVQPPEVHREYKFVSAMTSAIVAIKVSKAKDLKETLQLIEQMLSRDPGMTRDVDSFLAGIEITDQNEALFLAQLDSPVERMRGVTLLHLAKSKRDSVRQAVEKFVQNRTTDSEWVCAIRALGKIGSDKSLPKLEEILRDVKGAEGIRRTAMEAIAEIVAASPGVVTILDKTDDPYLVAIAFYYCSWRVDDNVKEAIHRARRRLGRQAFETVFEREPHPDIKRPLEISLFEFDRETAAPPSDKRK